jgi:nucleoid DNA-binding protein
MNYSIKEIKQAYRIVSEDLFQRLVKAKDNQTIHIGTLGSFGSLKKSESQMTSHMKGKSYGKTYAFYRIKFKPSRRLKAELNKVLEKKYRKK